MKKLFDVAQQISNEVEIIQRNRPKIYTSADYDLGYTDGAFDALIKAHKIIMKIIEKGDLT